MFNPQMMGQMGGQLPQIPSVKELWKNEKTKYRHWIVLLGVGLVVIFAILLAASIMNWVNVGSFNAGDVTLSSPSGVKGQIVGITGNGHGTMFYLAKAMFQGSNVSTGTSAQDIVNAVHRAYLTTYVIMPIIKLIFLLTGMILYADSLIKSYKAKTFAKISIWPTMIVGIAALLAFFSFFSFGSSMSFSDQFEFAGGVFTFVANLLFIIIYFAASAPVSRLRRTFMLSERIAALKAAQQDPAFQQAQQQFMNGQNPMGAFGPMAGMMGANANVQQNIKPATPEVNPERKKLENMSKVELTEVAKALSISGYTKMTKEELVKAILRVTENHENH